MLWFRMERRRVTEWKDGCVFHSEIIGHVWIPAKEKVECYNFAEGKKYDCDFLANTTDTIISKDYPV